MAGGTTQEVRSALILLIVALISISYQSFPICSSQPPSEVEGSFAGGDGTGSNPYQISNATTLQDLRLHLDACYVLVNDIDASGTKDWNGGKGFEPVGCSANAFNGSLDGKGFEIKDLYIKNLTDYVGLFGCAGSGARISNMRLSGASVTGKSVVGLIAGESWATITDCKTEGAATGNSWIGGISGLQMGDVDECEAKVKVTGGGAGGLFGKTEECKITNCVSRSTVSKGSYVGGMTGQATSGSSHEYCTSYANVSGDDNVGGLIGSNAGSVTECESLSNKAGGDEYVGGLVGSDNGGTVSKCSARTNVTGTTCVGGLVGALSSNPQKGSVADSDAGSKVVGSWSYIGGVVGYNKGEILGCHFVGSVTGSARVGGVAGWSNYNPIKNCYAKGDIKGNYIVGGLVGENQDSFSDGYFIGNVTGTGEEAMGIGGIVGSSSGTFTNCTSYARVTGYINVGGIAGWNSGKLKDSVSHCTVTANAEIGGIAGGNYGRIERNIAFCNVSGVKIIGGIAGWNDGPIIDSYAKCNLTGVEMVNGALGEFYNFKMKNSFFDVNSTTVNGRHFLDAFGIFRDQFDDWLKNNLSLDIDNYLEKNATDGSYEISSARDLMEVLPFTYYENHTYKLSQDIEMSENPDIFIPLMLEGILDGRGKAITNLSIDLPWKNDLGFIGRAAEKTLVRNLSLSLIEMEGKDYVGGLIGSGKGSLIDCHVSGDISGASCLGGLAGGSIGNITSCSSAADVSGEDQIGGLVGRNIGTISDSHSGGNVTGTRDGIGGAIGFNYGTIKDSESQASVSGANYVGGLIGDSYPSSNLKAVSCISWGPVAGSDGVGGIVGRNQGEIRYCISFGNVSGAYDVGGLVGVNTGQVTISSSSQTVRGNEQIGGLCGTNWGSIEYSHSDSRVTGSWAGGFVGANRLSIRVCSATGNVSGVGRSLVGGFAGTNEEGGAISKSFSASNLTGEMCGGFVSNNEGSITDCYSIGEVRGVNNVGGFVGYLRKGDVERTYSCGKVSGTYNTGGYAGSGQTPSKSSFWDIVTSGQTTSMYGAGLNTTEMRNKENFVAAGWDFTSIWIMGDGVSYPQLRDFYFPLKILGPSPGYCTEDENLSLRYLGSSCRIPGSRYDFVFSLDTEALWLNITNDGLLFGTPDNSDVGRWGVKVIMKDAVGSTDHIEFSLTVNNTNDAPQITTQDIETAMEDEEYLVEYEGLDIDPTKDALHWNITTDAEWMKIEGSRVFGVPGNGDVGTFRLNVTLSDGNGGIDRRNVTLKAENANDPPEILNESIPGSTEDIQYRVDLEATDIDPTGDVLHWRMETNASFLSIDGSAGIITGTPENRHVGTHILRVIVSDGKGAEVARNYTLTVLGVNDPPTSNVSFVVLVGSEDETLTLDVGGYFTDIDSEMELDSGEGSHMTVCLNGTQLCVTPSKDWAGEENVIVTATDGEFSAMLSILVIIRQVNDPPYGLIVDHRENYSYNESQIVSATASDPDLEYGDALTISWGSNSTGEIGTGEEIDLFLPEGNHTITVRATDSAGLFIEEMFEVIILGPEDYPHEEENESEEDPNETEGEDPVPSKDSGSVWVIFAIAALAIILAMGSAAAFFLIRSIRAKDDKAEISSPEETISQTAESGSAPTEDLEIPAGDPPQTPPSSEEQP